MISLSLKLLLYLVLIVSSDPKCMRMSTVVASSDPLTVDNISLNGRMIRTVEFIDFFLLGNGSRETQKEYNNRRLRLLHQLTK